MVMICFSNACLIKALIEIPVRFANIATRLCISGVRRTFNNPE